MKLRYLLGILVLGIFAGSLLLPETSHALSYTIANGAAAAKGNGQVTDLFGQTGVFKTVTNTMLFLVGAISVIMIIFGGLRYVISGGDSTAVQGAKNTILYAVVGIVVALMAYAAVTFVISSLTTVGGSGTSIAPTNG